MASRFDYPDPGTDPAYCDPLVAEPDDDRENAPESEQPDYFALAQRLAERKRDDVLAERERAK